MRGLDPELKAKVLADLKRGDAQRVVAKRYGLSSGTVASWAARDRTEKELAKARKAEERKRPAAKERDEAGKGEVVKKAERVREEPPPRARSGAPPQPPAQPDMAPALRRASRMAVAHRLAFLARPDSMHHKDAKSIALQLKLLVEATPDALSQATDATPQTSEAVQAELCAAFGISPADLERPPTLTAIAGGKAVNDG